MTTIKNHLEAQALVVTVNSRHALLRLEECKAGFEHANLTLDGKPITIVDKKGVPNNFGAFENLLKLLKHKKKVRFIYGELFECDCENVECECGAEDVEDAILQMELATNVPIYCNQSFGESYPSKLHIRRVDEPWSLMPEHILEDNANVIIHALDLPVTFFNKNKADDHIPESLHYHSFSYRNVVKEDLDKERRREAAKLRDKEDYLKRQEEERLQYEKIMQEVEESRGEDTALELLQEAQSKLKNYYNELVGLFNNGDASKTTLEVWNKDAMGVNELTNRIDQYFDELNPSSKVFFNEYELKEGDVVIFKYAKPLEVVKYPEGYLLVDQKGNKQLRLDQSSLSYSSVLTILDKYNTKMV